MDFKEIIEQFEHDLLIKIWELNKHSKTKTAQVLKLDRKTIYNKISGVENSVSKTGIYDITEIAKQINES